MELKKIQCSNCGSPMEVKPGLDRTRCTFCGMTYLVERKPSRNLPGPAMDASGDHPVDVLLEPFPRNTISLGLYHYPGISTIKEFNWDQSILKKEASWHPVDRQLLEKIRFLAALVFVTRETYLLDIGNFVIDPVFMYYDGSDPVTGSSFSKEQTGHLVEPRRMSSHVSTYPVGVLKDHKNGIRLYDQAINAKKNAAYKSQMDAMIRKYHLEYVDSEQYTPIETETFIRKTLFGRKEASRYWTRRYTDRRLFLSLDPGLARTFLSDEDVSRIERMNQVECLADMAAIIYREFSLDAKGQLVTRKYGDITLEIKQDQIVLKNPRRHVLRRGGSRTWESPGWIYITYSRYGMSPLDSLDLAHFLTAHLIRRIQDMIKANHDTDWNLIKWYDTLEKGMNLTFAPALKAVGVYNSWV